MIILSKTILIRHLGTFSYPYTPSDHQIYLLIISLHLKIDCVNVYGHLVYDITKLRLLQVCVDYTVKNDLDSAAGHHFLPYTPSDNQIYLLIISLQLKIDCVNVYVHLVTISLNCDYYRDALIIMSKTILIRHLGTISYPYTPSDHQIKLLIISLQLKIDCVNVYVHLVKISLNCDYYRDALIIMSKTILIRHLGTISYPYTPQIIKFNY